MAMAILDKMPLQAVLEHLKVIAVVVRNSVLEKLVEKSCRSWATCAQFSRTANSFPKFFLSTFRDGKKINTGNWP